MNINTRWQNPDGTFKRMSKSELSLLTYEERLERMMCQSRYNTSRYKKRRVFKPRISKEIQKALETPLAVVPEPTHYPSIDCEVRTKALQWMETGKRPMCGIF